MICALTGPSRTGKYSQTAALLPGHLTTAKHRCRPRAARDHPRCNAPLPLPMMATAVLRLVRRRYGPPLRACAGMRVLPTGRSIRAAAAAASAAAPAGATTPHNAVCLFVAGQGNRQSRYKMRRGQAAEGKSLNMQGCV